MASFRRMNDDVSNRHLAVCRKRSVLRIPELYELRRDGRRGENLYMAGETVKRPEGKVVCVRVGYEDRVERW